MEKGKTKHPYLLTGIFILVVLTCSAGVSTGWCQNGPLGTTIEGGQGLMYTQSARTYGVGSLVIGMKGLIMDKKVPVLSPGGGLINISDYSMVIAMPVTFGLTDEVDLTASLYGYHNGRAFLNSEDVTAGYGDLTGDIGASRFGLKIRLPFSQESPIQIAGKFGALVSTSHHQLDGANYRWTRTDTGAEASLIETFDLASFLSLTLEQGYVLSGTDVSDDQLIGAAGIQLRLRDRAVVNVEVVNRTFRGAGLSSVLNAGSASSRYRDPSEVGNIRYLIDSEADFGQDFFILAPSLSVRLTPHNTLDAGAIVNLADQAEPAEKVQGVIGVTFQGVFTNMVDSDRDGVNNRLDLEPDTPLGFPVDPHGMSLDGDRDGVPDGVDRELNTPPGALVNSFGIGRDSDGDGVYDGLDREPETPRGVEVDRNGIAFDSDRDGVPDGIDREWQTPLGAIVNAEGVSLDGDGDGVPDGIDIEPETILGANVDRQGVSLDGDGDGVPDGIDQEPNTPRGITVDTAGRAVIRQEYSLLSEGTIRLNTISFASGSDIIDQASYSVLDEIGQLLPKYPNLRIQIGGHTDNVGDRALNYRLSRERALAVRDYILTRFPEISLDRLQAVGYGSDKPVTTNSTAEGRRQNRRVEFVVINQDELMNINR